jgi:hypothetical protein
MTLSGAAAHLFWENIREVSVLGILSDAHHIHSAHKGQVVRHNLSQLGEMPAVPATIHTLILQF